MTGKEFTAETAEKRESRDSEGSEYFVFRVAAYFELFISPIAFDPPIPFKKAEHATFISSIPHLFR